MKLISLAMQNVCVGISEVRVRSLECPTSDIVISVFSHAKISRVSSDASETCRNFVCGQSRYLSFLR